MNKFPLIILYLVFTLSVTAQNLDSLFNQFVRIKSHYAEEVKYPLQQVTGENDNGKCGFGIVNEVKLNFNRFDPKQREVLAGLLSRPQADTSFLTPSGKFRIHYKKSGFDAPGYSLSELAKAADSSYNYEVNILGYPPPPGDNGAGGDDRHDIYIGNLSAGLYGYTEMETELSPNVWTSFMVIDNDFSTHNTKGINGARVTVAHEFHHAIQVGNYIYRSIDQYYHELSSSAMEEFVFNEINDYYFYLPSYLRNPQRPFSRNGSNDGYDLAAWNIFLKDRFGFGILKRTWELMREKRALNAISDAIAEAGSLFKNEFSLFGQWLYFTGERSVPNKYFKEAQNYPLIRPLMTSVFNKPQTIMNVASNPVSINYLVFTDQAARTDTFVAVVTNSDLTNGVNDLLKTLSFKYTISNQGGNGLRKVIDGYYTSLESDNSFLLSEMNIFNNSPVNAIVTSEINYAFPQPFRYSKDSFIFFPAGNTLAGFADLAIYSVDMDLVYNGELRIITSDKKVLMWDAIGNNGRKLSTGVYIYVVKNDNATIKGKFVIYND